MLISLYVLYAVKGSPKNEGLVDISEINEMRGIKTEEIKAVESPNLSGLEIFYHYVLKNKNAWYVDWMDTFVYMVRFGLISWLPIYLLETKGFNKEQIGIAFGFLNGLLYLLLYLQDIFQIKFLKAIECLLL